MKKGFVWLILSIAIFASLTLLSSCKTEEEQDYYALIEGSWSMNENEWTSMTWTFKHDGTCTLCSATDYDIYMRATGQDKNYESAGYKSYEEYFQSLFPHPKSYFWLRCTYKITADSITICIPSNGEVSNDSVNWTDTHPMEDESVILTGAYKIVGNQLHLISNDNEAVFEKK